MPGLTGGRMGTAPFALACRLAFEGKWLPIVPLNAECHGSHSGIPLISPRRMAYSVLYLL